MLNENIARVYADLVKKGIKKLDTIPSELRQLVEKILKESEA